MTEKEKRLLNVKNRLEIFESKINSKNKLKHRPGKSELAWSYIKSLFRQNKKN
jgi:hypothetical protein